MIISKQNPIICWWSGGITSAVSTRICINLFGIESCRIIFIDTNNESDDTYRFMKDCEKWYNKKIETISAIGSKYKSIQDVWFRFKSLNVAHGAICSSELKREVRVKFQKENDYSYQAQGYHIDEVLRAKAMSINYPDSRPIYPLLMFGLSKKDCFDIVEKEGIQIPEMYRLGFQNNNCFKTGCIQGGIGYWQKIKREYPDKFNKMANVEHELTELKGGPVTMLKDQSKEAKTTGNQLIFLKYNPKYPHVKNISMMKGREPKSLVECNGFCGINDLLKRKPEEEEINYETDN